MIKMIFCSAVHAQLMRSELLIYATENYIIIITQSEKLFTTVVIHIVVNWAVTIENLASISTTSFKYPADCRASNIPLN